MELYDISVHTGQLCLFYLSLFLCLFVPPLCLAHWWEGMEIILDLGRYVLLSNHSSLPLLSFSH